MAANDDFTVAVFGAFLHDYFTAILPLKKLTCVF